MHPNHVIIIVFSLFLPAAAFTQDRQAKPPSVDDLVAKNIAAKGGQQALQTLQSLKLSGKMLVNQDQIQLGFVQTKKRPAEVRTEVAIQGMTAVQAYDGKEGWQISPFLGRKDPEKMSADDIKELIEDAEIDGPLVDWKAKQSAVEYLGTEDVDGTLAYKLKVVRKDGDIDLVYLDPDYFLEIKVVTQRIQHGAQIEIEKDLSDYEKINGVFIPFSIETGPKAKPDKQKIVIDKAEPNVPVDDAIFHFPTTASK